MTFEQYQKLARKTAIYRKEVKNSLRPTFIYPLLGLAGEVGEIFEKSKKLFRDKKGKLNQEYRDLIEKELGDVLWYLSNLASEFGLSFGIIAAKNLEKLADRKKRKKLKGEGDLR